MFFKRVYDKSLAQASYLVGCQAKGEAIVIDAKRDIDTYIEIAEENNLTITHITETHIHADFLCGSRELNAVTGADMYLSDEGGEEWQYEFDHIGLKHGDKIEVGNLTMEVLHTPGHTPESISFLLTDHPATDKPVMVFTGDFVFVGDIGRPDLLEKAAGMIGTQEKGAKQMYESVQKFTKLPEYVQVWPAHGAGSACGKALGAVPSSTVGYELIRNWAFQYENDKEGFIDYLLDGQPEPPKYFARMKELNKVPRKLLIHIPTQEKLSKSQFLDAYHDGVTVIDTRPKEEYSKGRLPNTINIQNNNSFSTWAGWILNYENPFILIAGDEEIEQLTRMLMRIGLDNVMGYVNAIDDLGIELETQKIIGKAEFKRAIIDPNSQIVDVRGRSEYEEYHVEGADHVFVGTIGNNTEKIDTSRETVVHCQSGARATIAESILAKNEFKDIRIYSAGMEEWMAEETN